MGPVRSHHIAGRPGREDAAQEGRSREVPGGRMRGGPPAPAALPPALPHLRGASARGTRPCQGRRRPQVLPAVRALPPAVGLQPGAPQLQGEAGAAQRAQAQAAAGQGGARGTRGAARRRPAGRWRPTGRCAGEWCSRAGCSPRSIPTTHAGPIARACNAVASLVRCRMRQFGLAWPDAAPAPLPPPLCRAAAAARRLPSRFA